jgi:hypothetical protein
MWHKNKDKHSTGRKLDGRKIRPVGTKNGMLDCKILPAEKKDGILDE